MWYCVDGYIVQKGFHIQDIRLVQLDGLSLAVDDQGGRLCGQSVQGLRQDGIQLFLRHGFRQVMQGVHFIAFADEIRSGR